MLPLPSWNPELTEETDDPFNLPLATIRHDAVLAALREVEARTIIDLGCGSGALLQLLAASPEFARLAGMDVSVAALARAAARLGLDHSSGERVTLFQGSLTYLDRRLHGYDAAVLTEVIEHLAPERLPALERVVFSSARPSAVIVTTPNAEFNVNYAGLRGFRNPDHRFEWGRGQFQAWASGVAQRYGYAVTFRDVGFGNAAHGSPTQMGVFRGA